MQLIKVWSKNWQGENLFSPLDQNRLKVRF